MPDALVVVLVLAGIGIAVFLLKKSNKSRPVKNGYSSTDKTKTEG